MITSSGKQNDKEVETSIVHLMQMYTFADVIEVLQKPKSYPASSWHISRMALGICKFLFLKGRTAVWSGKESVQSVTYIS